MVLRPAQGERGYRSPIEVPAGAGTTGVPAPVANVILNGQAVILNGVKNLGFLPGDVGFPREF